ncbi:MAG: hypothetical protein Q9203_007473, partial [Teloschistes exilis]
KGMTSSTGLSPRSIWHVAVVLGSSGRAALSVAAVVEVEVAEAVSFLLLPVGAVPLTAVGSAGDAVLLALAVGSDEEALVAEVRRYENDFKIESEERTRQDGDEE